MVVIRDGTAILFKETNLLMKFEYNRSINFGVSLLQLIPNIRIIFLEIFDQQIFLLILN
jgi:hypothetical protein